MDLHYFSLVWVLYLIASMSANKVELAVPELPENNMVTGGTDLLTREIEKRVSDTYYNLSMIGSSEPSKRLQTAYVNSTKVVTRRVTRFPLRSGDTIALRSMCATKGWVSNWCTKNCGEITRPRQCPGTNFGRHEIKRCGGEALIIVAEGRRRGESIRSNDVIGLYYGGGYWMSCEGYKKNCKTRPCPGPISNYKNSGWRWNKRCHWEMFRIKFSRKVHNGALLYNGDEVVIQREIPGRSGCSRPSNWYLSEEGRRITLRDCPGCNNGNIKRRCRCEAFQLTTFGRYYSMG